MSVLVKGMEMPTACQNGKCNFACSAAYQTGLICVVRKQYVVPGDIPIDCPCSLVPPHGRLIDADALEVPEDVQPMKWIPVTEKLPEEYKNVLCYYEYFRYGDFNCMFRTIDRGYYGDGIWGGEAGQGHKNKVLAWMPLPEPPKEE